MFAFYVRLSNKRTIYNGLDVFEEINEQSAFSGYICNNVDWGCITLGVF